MRRYVSKALPYSRRMLYNIIYRTGIVRNYVSGEVVGSFEVTEYFLMPVIHIE